MTVLMHDWLYAMIASVARQRSVIREERGESE
jgi:hypothetical protein